MDESYIILLFKFDQQLKELTLSVNWQTTGGAIWILWVIHLPWHLIKIAE